MIPQIPFGEGVDPLCCKLSDVDPEWFFSEDPREIRLARSICSQCPIERECLEWANLIEEGSKPGHRFGIYGGLTGAEREKASLEIG